MIPYREVQEKARELLPGMTRFLRDMIALPGESTGERDVILRIRKEMEAAGCDRVEIDPMGNVLGFIGSGKHLIAFDGHADTVGVGDPSLWKCHPYEGHEDGETVMGRGASDQKGGLAAMVFAGRIIRELGLFGDCTLMMAGTVQEEDCDGLCWQYIIGEDGYRPEFVVLTEPTSCTIARGQRGRMEIRVSAKGVSCHGSAPERGENAIYKMAPVIGELRDLHERLPSDPFLGRGSLAVSEIFSSSPSRCAVADGCSISVDRRLTLGETRESALQEIRELPSVRAAAAEVSVYSYSRPSWTGLVYPTECFFPAWVLGEDHPACRVLSEGYRGLFGTEPVVDKWTFSTNGVSIMGLFGIPCAGFGPGHEDQAHAPNERTWKEELVRAAALYALVPALYSRKFATAARGD